MTAQPALIDVPSHSVDEQTAALLDYLAHKPDPEGDYRKIVVALLKAAREGRQILSANDVRKHLVDADGHLTINPSRMGSTFRVLARAGVLIPSGHVTSDDFASRNTGKPLRRYQFRPDRIPYDQAQLP